MDWMWITLGVVLTIAGIAGCILPFIPGPPLSYSALLVLLIVDEQTFTSRFLIVWLLVTTVVTILDYYVPVWGTKKFGGSRKGVWGATIGLVAGIFFFPPFGMIAGPFLGAFLGELIEGKDTQAALRSGFGSFIGFVAGTVMKLTVSVIMAFYFFRAVI
ncbi:MAG: DUF456 domain-containing protein [Bacteroidales bacterium]|nr:DUF456 domain-containing protein [Bacteroidales bacterium]MBK9357506.1 DUF456 domain-containing protein [Bacteroidales bacterium]